MDTTRSKDILRACYRVAVGAAALAALPLRSRDHRVAIFYGGARAGDFGGPLVKVKLLQQRFPQHFPGYSLLYILSNAIYLPQPAISRLRNAGLPLVFNQNGIFYKAWFPHGWERENARMAGVHTVADHVFYQSEFCRECAERFLGPRKGSSEILYNAVDVTQFTPAPEQRNRSPFTFLVTGRISRSTAHRLFSSVQGLAMARRGGLDVAMIIAGGIEPEVKTRVRREVEELDVSGSVTFSGPYRWAAAPALYRSADAYLMTKHNDPCPNSVLEALASGLPVLYSASGGVPELVGEDAGIGLPIEQTFERAVVPTAEAIAEGMAKIMRVHAPMAAAARQRAVERFALSHWFDRHAAVFERLLNKRAPL
jgi:glycosyltransferase involved in cell wall biosynthesis